ncbi:EAL domain-containing protein [Citrobacter portucalensis]|uniref:EAL domain-containing protein n=1 Tax=Citrobacter portucalensis TaxID=1639133 RepID=UPI00351D94F4
MKNNHNLKRIKPYVISITFSFFIFFSLSEISMYYIYKERIASYTERVLNRSVSLIQQIDKINDSYEIFNAYSPCSELQLHALRVALWPYALIKDISFISNGAVICSALWGVLPAPLLLNIYDRKVEKDNVTWFFGVLLENNVKADLLSNQKLAITISPFAFNRFVTDHEEKGFSAIVGDRDHSLHLFKLGEQVDLLEEAQHDKSYQLGLITTQSCNKNNNICVMGGVKFPWMSFDSWLTMLLISFTSIVTGVLLGGFYNQRVARKQSLVSRLKNAIRSESLYLVYQPIYKIKTGKIIGVEALIRWDDHDIGSIPPDIFIPIAEKHGLIHGISDFVFRMVVKQTMSLSEEFDIFISINVSSQDLLSESFQEKVFQMIDESNIKPGMIMMELTERQSAEINSLQKVISLFNNKGISIAIDDFGTGHSNLNWLSNLQIDEIKIDKSITDSIDECSINNNVLSGLVEIFKDITHKVVFEGVETSTQVKYLTEMFPECGVQGWYYSKPLSIDKLTKLVEDANLP